MKKVNKQPLLLIILLLSVVAYGQNNPNTVGLIHDSSTSYNGYTLFTPMSQKETFLINNEGKLLHSWQAISIPGHTVYLNEDGTLYRTGQIELNQEDPFLEGRGGGGKVERYDWDSNLLWNFTYADDTKKQHHDFQVLPNGNVLILAWELKTKEEAIQAGRDPSGLASEALWPDHIVEVKPEGVTGGTIVWEWHIWDHLVQDFDDTKDNYGVVEDNPNLIDINYFKWDNPGWNHINAMNYNAELDQIALSVWAFDEIWIIDHSTTTQEAKSHSGGVSGKGGDLLFRWGNPRAFKRGEEGDQKLFQQHNVHWIPKGLPNEGKLMLFNNGTNRLGNIYSAINIIDPVEDINGNYTMNMQGRFEPSDFSYTYTDTDRTSFFSGKFSSAQQLPNGNILVGKGPQGEFFEIDSNNEIVWNYINPITPNGPLTQSDSPLGVNSVFRVIRYAPDYAAFNGKTLVPQSNLELTPVVAGLLNEKVNPIRIYPNPSANTIQINGLESIYSSISIYNAQGKLVYSREKYKANEHISVSKFPNGIYLVYANGNSLQKLLIAH